MILHTRGKSNKYNARKTTVCGRIFDSKREAECTAQSRSASTKKGRLRHSEPQEETMAAEARTSHCALETGKPIMHDYKKKQGRSTVCTISRLS